MSGSLFASSSIKLPNLVSWNYIFLFSIHEFSLFLAADLQIKSFLLLVREQNVSLLSKLNKMSSSCTLMDEVPRLPIPINKMNCSVARTSLARLLRYRNCNKLHIFIKKRYKNFWTVFFSHFGYQNPGSGSGFNESGSTILEVRYIAQIVISVENGFFAHLRFHCGANPKYGLVETMPVWWPNEVFEWTALKNLSHRFEGKKLKTKKNSICNLIKVDMLTVHFSSRLYGRQLQQLSKTCIRDV